MFTFVGLLGFVTSKFVDDVWGLGCQQRALTPWLISVSG
jgi:hypothetical protein